MCSPKTFRVVFVSILSCLIISCGSPTRKQALSDWQLQNAQVNGLSSVRFIPSTPQGIDAYLDELKTVVPKRGNDPKRESNYLSLSGGGDNGAFGAGLLSGWTQQGSRPVFDQVVGISTGSLIAPYAYLGSEYDKELEQVFTSVKPEDIYKKRSVLSLVFGNGMADSSPLFKLIQQKMDRKVLDRIASEYEQHGRLLLIGTTNIDTGQLVIWNMGKIAANKTPQSENLFHRVMLASAAVPGIFPPELFDATFEGKDYQELHVDGGLSVQIYLYPAAVSKIALASGIVKPRKRNAFIIRNATISVEKANTEINGLSLLERSYKKILQAQGVGNLYQTFQIAGRDKVGFNLAFIGDDFSVAHPEEFDQAYMRALFDYGYRKAIHGYPWNKTPPGFEKSTKEDIKALSQ